VSGWSNEMFNNNLLPLTHEQVVLRRKVQAWLAERYRTGATVINFADIGDRFPGANYSDLMCVYDDFHREGFLEEVHGNTYHGTFNSCDLSDDEEE
jgi:hypothetical protein